MLTTRQAELLKRLPRDESFLAADFIKNERSWQRLQTLYSAGLIYGRNRKDYWYLTPAGQAEWDKLQQEASK